MLGGPGAAIGALRRFHGVFALRPRSGRLLKLIRLFSLLLISLGLPVWGDFSALGV